MGFARGLGAGTAMANQWIDTFNRSRDRRVTRDVEAELARMRDVQPTQDAYDDAQARYYDHYSAHGLAPTNPNQSFVPPQPQAQGIVNRLAPGAGQPNLPRSHPSAEAQGVGLRPEAPSEAALTRRAAQMFREQGRIDLANDAEARADALTREEAAQADRDRVFDRQSERFGVEDSRYEEEQKYRRSRDEVTDAYRRSRDEATDAFRSRQIRVQEQEANARVANTRERTRALGIQTDRIQDVIDLEDEYTKFVAEGGQPALFVESEAYKSASPSAQRALVAEKVGVNNAQIELGAEQIRQMLDGAGSTADRVRMVSEDETLTPGTQYQMEVTEDDEGNKQYSLISIDSEGEAHVLVPPSSDQARIDRYLYARAQSPELGAVYISDLRTQLEQHAQAMGIATLESEQAQREFLTDLLTDAEEHFSVSPTTPFLGMTADMGMNERMDVLLTVLGLSGGAGGLPDRPGLRTEGGEDEIVGPSAPEAEPDAAGSGIVGLSEDLYQGLTPGQRAAEGTAFGLNEARSLLVDRAVGRPVRMLDDTARLSRGLGRFGRDYVEHFEGDPSSGGR